MFTEMKDVFFEERIKIPEQVEVSVEKSIIKVNGPKGENSRRLVHPYIIINKEGNDIVLQSSTKKKTGKRLLKTFKAHIENMIDGVQKIFVYKMKICASHFPISTKVEGNRLVVSNFLGEKVPRYAKILPSVNVKVEGDQIIVQSSDLESAGQTCSNIEIATKVKGRDRRVFADGIFIMEKP